MAARTTLVVLSTSLVLSIGQKWWNSNDKSTKALFAAVAKDDAMGVAQAVEEGAAIDEVLTIGALSGTPLMHAVLTDHDQATWALLLAGASVTTGNDKYRTILDAASGEGKAAAIRMLWKAGVEVVAPAPWIIPPAFVPENHRDGYHPLHRACWSGHADAVRALLELGVNAATVTHHRDAEDRTNVCLNMTDASGAQLTTSTETRAVIEAFLDPLNHNDPTQDEREKAARLERDSTVSDLCKAARKAREPVHQPVVHDEV